MNLRMEQLERRLVAQHHKDLFLQTTHTLAAINDLADEHRRFQSMQAISGVKIIGSEEAVFYDTLTQIKETIIATLEKTIDDLEHKGDKHYKSNFKEGVE
ncbi:hypothetical protein [Paenibacillus sp. NPDC058071]|uniref:hypothetical protein n=1 Tax=Paenibacillus sp. NPDC058071 TaxID=3346326 RepID=UPI0036D787C3